MESAVLRGLKLEGKDLYVKSLIDFKKLAFICLEVQNEDLVLSVADKIPIVQIKNGSFDKLKILNHFFLLLVFR